MTDRHDLICAAARPRLMELVRSDSNQHTVICLLNGMGDAFLALPLIRLVIQRFGADHVSVLANEYHCRTVFAELGSVLVPTSESNRRVAAERKEVELVELKARLPCECRPNWVSLNPYSPRTVVEDYAIAALTPRSLWEFRGSHIRVDASTGSIFHRLDQYFRVIGEYCAPEIDRRPLVDPELGKRATEIRDHVHQSGKRLVAVHAQTYLNKRWPELHWLELGKFLRNQCELIILGVPEQTLSGCQDYLTAPYGWAKQVALLAVADAFVGIDSCFSHVADAFNLPGVVMYRDAETGASWLPRTQRLKPLFPATGGLDSISPADVADRVLALLNSNSTH